MMLAYGAYVPTGVSLVWSSLVVSGSILLVFTPATVMIFPLVYAYGLDPAQGPDLVFNVLPIAFGEMPAGRLVGTLFFVLLLLSALTPTLAGLEPLVAWFQERRGISRARAAFTAAGILWILGLPSVLSFNIWAGWHPFAAIPRLKAMTVFDTLDFACSNLMLTVGALLTVYLNRMAIAESLCGHCAARRKVPYSANSPVPAALRMPGRHPLSTACRDSLTFAARRS